MVGSSAPPLVLVAEDEPTMLELVVRHLKSITDPKLEVIEASDGDEAWRLAMERLPDLVVLDVMMPGMSGWEVCRKIREDKGRFAHTSVVMLTGIGEKVNEMTSPLYGADAYIDKPFEFEDLDSKVKEALEARAEQRELVPRPVRNGVHAPARAAKPGSTKPKAKAKAKPKIKAGASKAKASASSKKKTPQKKQKAVLSNKGTSTMAAKKKSAKKGAKKGAKKAKKSAKKK